MSPKKDLPLEVIITLSLIANKHHAKGEIMKYSPEQTDDDFGYFFSGRNERNLALFSSGARQVYYNGDQNSKYTKKTDVADFDGEYQIPIRTLTYALIT